VQVESAATHSQGREFDIHLPELFLPRVLSVITIMERL